MELLRHHGRVADDPEMECPRDGTVMENVQSVGVRIERCLKCEGLWIDESELARVAEADIIEKRATRRDDAAPATMDCPRCGAPCHESWVARVCVDRCSACGGAWLDGGELSEATRVDGSGREGKAGFRAFLAGL